MNYQEFTEKFNIRLNEQQNQAVQACQGPVILLAVPGSGKTTVLVARLGYLIYGLGVDPAQILTVTYTVAAARDMENRFFRVFGGQSLRTVPFSTIHSLCAGIIRHYERVRQTKAFTLISREMDQSRILRQLIQAQTGEPPGDAMVRDAATQITYCKNKMLNKTEIEKISVDHLDFPKLYWAYEGWKRTHQKMDFDDQLEFARRILLKNPDILSYYRHKYRYIQVDEAQDTSKIQHVILRMLLNPEHNLFMVGDEDQSIYGFRAAYPQALLEFPKLYPEAKVLYMEKNYRSVPDIVLRADQFIAQNRSRYAKHMTAEREAIPGLAVQQVSFPDSSQQYDWLLEQARHPAEQTAVLYRNHDSVLPLLDLLEREGLPYGLRESNVLFFSHFAVRDILDILQFAHHPDNPELFRKIYYKIGRNIRKVDMDRVLKGYSGGHLVKAVRDLPGMEEWRIHKLDDCISALGQLKKLPMPQALRCILQDLSYQEYYYHRTDDDNRLRILRALANQNREPAAFLKRLDRLKDLVKTGSQDLHFLLSTMHASKGLEFDRVILLDVRDGILPTVEEPAHGGQLDAEDRALLEEERRLFYVAVTRAKNKLEILRCERESGVAVRGSRFAKQLLEDENKTRKSFRRKRIELGEDKRLGTLWDYQPGDVVWHVRFGTGSVVSRNGDEVTIVFSSKWGEKSLMLPACLEGCLLYLVETEK